MNLLPDNSKYEVSTEYKLRFFLFLTLFFASAAIIGIVVMVPKATLLGSSYFSFKTEINNDGMSDDEKTDKSLDDFKDELRVLDPKNIGYESFHYIVAKIVDQKPQSVAITSFTMSHDTENTGRYILSGVSENREGLVEFSKKLSESKMFKSVDLPVSNLSKKEKIDFSISLIIERKTN